MRALPGAAAGALVAIALATALAAETPAPQLLLPRGEAVPGWRLAEEPSTYPADDLWRHIDGAAEQYLSFGCTELAVGYYRRNADEIAIEVYRTRDARGSFGLYALERSTSEPLPGLGAEGYASGGEVICFGGPYYIKVRAYPENDATRAAALALARVIAAAHLGGSAFPAELGLFPRAPIAPAALEFVPQSVLGLSSMRDALLARYRHDAGELSLYLARPGGAEAAEAMHAALQRELAARGVRPPEETAVAGGRGLRGELKYHGPVLLLRRGGDLILAVGALDADWARALVDSLAARLALGPAPGALPAASE
jgi:hypothetical protein